MTVFLVIAAAALLAVTVTAWVLCQGLIHPDAADYDRCYLDELALGGTTREKFEVQYHKEEFFLSSFDGCPLHCMLIYPPAQKESFADGRARVAVIAHGYTYTLFGSMKYVDIFRSLGFYCVVYDQRNHGKSGKAPTTMGLREEKDLATVCAWARERFGSGCVLGTHGESMGAACVLLHAKSDDSLAFVIEDSGYSDLSRQLAFAMKVTYHLPRFPFLPVASLFSRLRGSVLFSQVCPMESIARCRESLPMLFIHGDGDDLVPAAMARENYAAKRGKKRLELFHQQGHAQSWFSHPRQYAQLIESFLRENEII